MKIWKKILIGFTILFVAIQFIPSNRNVPTVISSYDFIQVEKPPVEIATMIKNACYDCHSYETKYPWYSNIAPVSWWLDSHINEAREHLNFSIWAMNGGKNDAREECAEEIAEGKMPMQSYTLMHREARLSNREKQALENWFNQNAPNENKGYKKRHEDEEDEEE